MVLLELSEISDLLQEFLMMQLLIFPSDHFTSIIDLTIPRDLWKHQYQSRKRLVTMRISPSHQSLITISSKGANEECHFIPNMTAISVFMLLDLKQAPSPLRKKRNKKERIKKRNIWEKWKIVFHRQHSRFRMSIPRHEDLQLTMLIYDNLMIKRIWS